MVPKKYLLLLMRKEKRKRNELQKGAILNFFSVSRNDVHDPVEACTIIEAKD